jgi:hypothetical protein
MRPDVDLRRGSGGPGRRGSSERGAVRRGSPIGGDGEVDCVLAWVNGAAGDVRCAGELWSRTSALIRCRIESRRGSGRCTGSRRR